MKRRPVHRLLARCLSGALGQTLAPSDLPATESEWQKVLRRSSAHLVTPALRWAFRKQGLTSQLPTDVLEFLDAVYALNLEANRQYERQLADLICSLNSIGVRPLLLKGAAALVGGLYPTPGDRMIGDIDILIPASTLPPVLDKVTAAGYRATKEEFNHGGHHYAPIASPDWPAAVELHVHPVVAPLRKLLASSELFRDATPLSWCGGECFLASPSHFIVHNVTHAFLQDFKGADQIARPLSQRQLFEFVHACRTWGQRISWGAVKDRFDKSGYGYALRQYITLCEAYFCFEPPPGIDPSAWNRFRVEAHLFRLDQRAIDWSMVAFTNLRPRARNLIESPRRSVKKLMSAGFYLRLWSDITETQ